METLPIEKLEIVPTKSNYGGKRPGSGRKPITDKFTVVGQKEIFWEILDEKDAEGKNRFHTIVKNYLIRAQRDDKAAQYVIDQVVGRAAQKLEVTGKDGEALLLKITC